MTSLPDQSNDYQAPLVLALSRAVWNAVFGSIGARLRALEGTTADYEAAIAQLETQALAVISATITDEITARRADFDQLEEDIALAQDEIAFLRAGGIDAGVVTLTSIVGLAAANAQAAIAELLTKIEAETEARTEALASLKPVKFTSVSANANLDIGGAYRLRAASITLTLPAAPANGDTIRIVDGEVISSENTVTIARNGQTIMGLAENLTLDVAGLDMTIWFTGTTWRLF